MEVRVVRRPLKLTRSVHIIRSSNELQPRNDAIRLSLKAILSLVFLMIACTLSLCHRSVLSQLSPETVLAIPSGLVAMYFWVAVVTGLFISRTLPFTHLPGLAPRIRYGRRHISRMRHTRYVRLVRQSSTDYHATSHWPHVPVSVFILGLLASSFLIPIDPSAHVFELYKQLANRTAVPISPSSHNLYHYAWSSSPLPATAPLYAVRVKEASTIHVRLRICGGSTEDIDMNIAAERAGRDHQTGEGSSGRRRSSRSRTPNSHVGTPHLVHQDDEAPNTVPRNCFGCNV